MSKIIYNKTEDILNIVEEDSIDISKIDKVSLPYITEIINKNTIWYNYV